MTEQIKPDLWALWQQHCAAEFDQHDVTATMATMVEEPYVNHIPTLTGGTGKSALTAFYRDHFVSKLPSDVKTIPISQTVGESSIVDEMIFCFTHDHEMDFMLPGVPPTGKYVEIPLVAIVRFEGDKIAHEHIYWDQASLLVQLGLLDPANLPVAGIETAQKVRDKHRTSNTLLAKQCSSSDHIE
ncbi:MAG: ester cyclase [Candidatus Obscuribacterales bacterium]|nr:ester cyclase [Candidatus Obscuribacterales bacterium]